MASDIVKHRSTIDGTPESGRKGPARSMSRSNTRSVKIGSSAWTCKVMEGRRCRSDTSPMSNAIRKTTEGHRAAIMVRATGLIIPHYNGPRSHGLGSRIVEPGKYSRTAKARSPNGSARFQSGMCSG